MKRAMYLGLCMTLLLLTGCANNALGIDSGLFIGKPCKAPCWNGLTPGVSTANDVELFLQGLSIKNWPARDTLVSEKGCSFVRIADRLDDTANAFVDMHIDKGKLVYILSVHDNMPSLQQIVDHLGPPDYFRAVHVIGPHGEIYMLTVYYLKGIVFDVTVDLNDLGFTRPEMRVSSIEYYESGDLLSYFGGRYCGVGQEGATSTAQIQMAEIQPWSGFGQVNVIESR